MSETLSYRALCTNTDVANVLGGSPDTDTLIRLVNAATTEIYQFIDREVISVTNPTGHGSPPMETRIFDVSIYGLGGNEIRVGDMQSVPTVITICDHNGNLVSTPNLTTQMDLFPRIRQEWEPYEYIRFRNGISLGAQGYPQGYDYPPGWDYQVHVTSWWGFASVPEDIRNDCIETVRLWYDQIKGHSATGEQDYTASQQPRNLPPHVLVSLNKYRRLNA